ncbi:MAG TPA: ABC transporter permease [Capillimicrobium sp.]
MSTAVPLERPSAPRRAGALAGLRRQGALAPIAAFAVMIVVYASVNPDLFTRIQLQTLANLVAPLALVALAELLVVLVGGIDISVGAVMSLASVVFATMLGEQPVALAVLAAVGAAIGCGVLNGVLVAYGRLPAIATTLASAFIFGALANEVLDRPGGSVSTEVTNATSGEFLPYVPAALVWVLIAAVALWLVLNRTVLGRQIYGAGSSAAALRTSGHDPRRAQLAAFVIGAILTALAAILLVGSTATGDPKSGDPYLLNAIAAVALGGAAFSGGQGSVSGVVCAAGVLGTIGSLLFFAGINSYWQYVIGSAIIIVVVGLPALVRRARGQAGGAR